LEMVEKAHFASMKSLILYCVRCSSVTIIS
jgi:hypothetical protein